MQQWIIGIVSVVAVLLLAWGDFQQFFKFL